jgi:hypothetical protein
MKVLFKRPDVLECVTLYKNSNLALKGLLRREFVSQSPYYSTR